MFEEAREYNRLHQEDVIHFDVTGYEYSLVRPYEPYKCVVCGKEGLGIAGVTGYARVAYYDEQAPLGRSQKMKGAVCSEHCAFNETGSVPDLVQYAPSLIEEDARQPSRPSVGGSSIRWAIQGLIKRTPFPKR